MKNIVRFRIKAIETEIFAFYCNVKKQHEDAITLSKENNQHLLNSMLKREKKINQEYNRFFKNTIYDLAKYSLFGNYLRKILGYSYISNELERIGDYAYNICLLLINKKLLFSEAKELIPFWEQLFLVFQDIEEFFFCKDKKILLNFLKNKSSRKLSWDKFLTKINSHQQKPVLKWAFSEYFNSLQRSLDHLENVVEYLLLILSFEEYKNYKKNCF